VRWYTLQRLRCLCAVGIAADTLTFSGISDLNYTFLVSYGNKVVCKGCIQQDSHATTSSTLVRMATHSYLLKGQSRQPRTVNLTTPVSNQISPTRAVSNVGLALDSAGATCCSGLCHCNPQLTDEECRLWSIAGSCKHRPQNTLIVNPCSPQGAFQDVCPCAPSQDDRQQLLKTNLGVLSVEQLLPHLCRNSHKGVEIFRSARFFRNTDHNSNASGFYCCLRVWPSANLTAAGRARRYESHQSGACMSHSDAHIIGLLACA